MARSRSHPGLVTTGTQLLQTGWTPARIRAQLDAGRWRRVGHAIVLHNGPLSREQRWRVAHVHAGPRSLLTGHSAASVFGLRGWERDVVDVLVPAGARISGRSPVPLRVHRRRDWDAVRRSDRGPVHHRADALLVAAAAFIGPRPACGILAAAVQQRVLPARELTEALADAPRVRHRGALVAAVADIRQGADALSEIDFVRLCRRYRLPAPAQQSVRRLPGGRRRYLDASWRRTDGRLVVVEIDGALHLNQRRWWDDQLRQNEITLQDALLLRYPSVIVRAEPDLVADQLGRALGIRHASVRS